MNILPELIVPDALCRFENYTQSIPVLEMIMWILAIWGLFNILFNIITYFRIGGSSND